MMRMVKLNTQFHFIIINCIIKVFFHCPNRGSAASSRKAFWPSVVVIICKDLDQSQSRYSLYTWKVL